MYALLIAAVWAANPGETEPVSLLSEVSAVESEQPIIPFRTGRELLHAAEKSLRHWAQPEDEQLESAAKDLLVLFQELQADTELAASLREPLVNKVRGRLAELARRLKVQAAVRRRLARENGEDKVDAVADLQPLPQFAPGMGPGAGMAPGMGGNAWNQGGMGLLGQNMSDDNGEQLVDLIQTTIRPNSWDRVGGPGTIYYWRNQRAIVVRQMGEVHDEIGDLLQQMNRLGH